MILDHNFLLITKHYRYRHTKKYGKSNEIYISFKNNSLQRMERWEQIIDIQFIRYV